MVSSFDSARGLAAAGNDGGAQVKAAKKSKRLNHKKRFSLLIVRGDGARIVRISFPKKIPAMIFVGVGVFASVLAVLIGDWWHVRQRIRDSASLYRQIDEQRATIEGMNRRVAQLHQEVSGWRDVHGRIWEAFGPDIAPKKSGIGGRATPPDRRAIAHRPARFARRQRGRRRREPSRARQAHDTGAEGVRLAAVALARAGSGQLRVR